MLFLFEFMITEPHEPKAWTRLVLILAGQGIILPFNLLTYCNGQAGANIVRAMGPCFYAALIMIAFLIRAWHNSQQPSESRAPVLAELGTEEQCPARSHLGNVYVAADVVLDHDCEDQDMSVTPHSLRAWWLPPPLSEAESHRDLCAFGAATGLLAMVFCIFLFCQVRVKLNVTLL